MRLKYLYGLLLSLVSVVSIGQSVVTYPASGHAATEEWVQNYVFDMMERYVKSDCDLSVDNVVQDGTALEFGIRLSLQGVNQYTIKIEKGEEKYWWYSVPYVTGSRLRIEDVPPLDSIRITIRPTQFPTCYYSFGYNAGGGNNPDPGDSTIVTPDPNCTEGPTILSVSNVTANGLTTQFHGLNVTLMNYKVLDASNNVVRSGQVVPTSAILNLSFSSALPVGSYTLRLEGANCVGFSTFPFTLSGDNGGTSPPSGNIIAKFITKGLPEHMNIQVTGTGADKKITDLATLTPPDGYEFRYFINDVELKRNSRLIDYPWPSDVPVAIYKFQIRPDVTNIFTWGRDEGWKDPNAGATFSYNTTCAFATIIFDDAVSGYNINKKVPQWMDYLPDMPATDNKVWVMPKGPISTTGQLEAKGITNFSKYEITSLSAAEQQALQDAGKTYDEVPQTQVQLSLPDRGAGQWKPDGQVYPYIWNTRFFDYTPGQTEPLTLQQGADKGNQYSTAHRIVVFENSEQDHAIGGQWPFWKPYYQNYTNRLQSRFPSRWRVAHNYFTGAINQYPDNSDWASKRAAYGSNPSVLGFMTRLQAKNFLNAPLSDYPPSSLLPGNNMENVNSACYGLYFNSIQDTPNNPYRMIYAAHLTHKASKYLFAFMQSFYEWNPNNLQETIFPEGKFYKYVKMPHSPAQCVNYALISRVFMDGFIPFSSAAKTDGNFRFDRQYWNNSLWYPNGTSSPQNNDGFPYWKQPGQSEAFPTTGFEDAIALGMYQYSQTFMQTSGGPGTFLRFRIDGGAWQEPSNININDVVDAYYDKRGICYGQTKNGKLAVMYMNPYADNSLHTIEYQYNGVTYSMQVASIQAQTKLHNL